MVPTENGLISVERSHRLEVASTLAKAFQSDPLYSYVIPDERKRAKALLWLMQKVVDYSILYGKGLTTDLKEGGIFWLPPDQTKLTLLRIFRTGLHGIVFRFGIISYSRFSDNMSYTDEIHERFATDPHWYLWAIGVSPSFQGKGIGSKLMQPVLNIADNNHLPCYLETHNEHNIRFYENHGFKVVNEGRIPKHNLRVWAMLRKSRH
jgi:ribosomal protein S18 acetylase RimI-like enzyme